MGGSMRAVKVGRTSGRSNTAPRTASTAANLTYCRKPARCVRNRKAFGEFSMKERLQFRRHAYLGRPHLLPPFERRRGVVLSRQNLRFTCFLGCVVLLFVAGCGGSDNRPKVYPVSGEFFVKGEPAAGARLTLQPAIVSDPKLWPMGYPIAIVQADGKFQFSSYAENDGAPEGEYKLLAKWEEGDGIPNEDPTVPPPKQKLDPSYLDPVRSPWSVVVEKKSNQLTRYEVP